MIAPKVPTDNKYLRVCHEALEDLRSKDLRERCEAADMVFDAGGIRIPFLGTRYFLSLDPFGLEREGGKNDCLPTDISHADSSPTREKNQLVERILILDYMRKASGAPLSGILSGFDQLAGGRFYGGAFNGRVEIPLARLLSAEPRLLSRVAGRLGGTRSTLGEDSLVLAPLPRVPLTLVFWQGDDEVPSRAKALFDSRVEEYLSTEDIAVLGEVVVRRLKEESHV